MNYIDPVRKALRAELVGCPAGLIDQYVTLVLVRGQQVTMKDVHHAWASWTSRFKSGNPYLVPFDDLLDEVKDKDRVYMEVIKKVAAELIDVPRETKEEE